MKAAAGLLCRVAIGTRGDISFAEHRGHFFGKLASQVERGPFGVGCKQLFM